MSNGFKDREKGFEAKYQHDQEMQFLEGFVRAILYQSTIVYMVVRCLIVLHSEMLQM
jgi:hypothetical protein